MPTDRVRGLKAHGTRPAKDEIGGAISLPSSLREFPRTALRLRGEVGNRAPARGFRVRGKRPSRDGGSSSKGPSPRPSPRKRGEGKAYGSATANVSEAWQAAGVTASLLSLSPATS